MTDQQRVVIIGAGIGGMCTGALLARAGYHVTVCDQLNTVGGRTRTQTIEGYELPRGAVSFQLSGVLPTLCEEVGAEFELRPVNEMWFWMKGDNQFVPLPARGGIGTMLELFMKVHAGKDGKQAMAQVGLQMAMARIGKAFKDPEAMAVQGDGPTFREWLEKYTDNQELLHLFHTITSAVSAVNDFEYPARHWFAHFAATEARMDKYAMVPGGFVAVSRALGKVIEDCGGEIRLSTPVESIQTGNGRATGVNVIEQGAKRFLAADVVVSNSGPMGTLALVGEAALGAEYVQKVRSRIRPTPIVATYVISDEPLFDARSAILAAGLRRIVTGVPLTNICPEWAPDGKHLMAFYGTPKSCIEPMDREDEIQANTADIHDLFPYLQERGGRILEVQLRDINDADVVARTWPGYGMPVTTPIPNLFNVGDACAPEGFVATPAAAKSARLASEAILAL